MIADLALDRAAALVNRALDHDPASRAALARLAGRALAIQCTLPTLDLAISTDGDGNVSLSRGAIEGAETCLRGSALSLARLATDRRPGATLAGSGVTLTGNQELPRELQAILGELDIDWEAALAGLLGDVPAHLIAESVRAGIGWQRQARERIFSGGGEYLREEARAVLGRDEMAPWEQQVREVAEATDRLAAKLARLQRRLASGVP